MGFTAGMPAPSEDVHPSEGPRDATWPRAVMEALRDPILLADADGLVTEVNEGFAGLTGYGPDDCPYAPPYPWWPTADEDPGALAEIVRTRASLPTDTDISEELVIYTKDRCPVWVDCYGSLVGSSGRSRIWVLRDITHDKQAQRRRAAAARVSADFSRTDDLAALLGVAAHGFALLFDGVCTLELDLEERHLFSAGRTLCVDDLPPTVAAGLAGQPSADTVSRRPGILLVPATSTTHTRAWVQFPRPRRISSEEMIAADLLAQAFGLALDRVIELQRSADRQVRLQQAIDSHRMIGQAVGILVERHRLLPDQAFDRLKQASQNRNLKLRELAVRVIETGDEPETA